MDFEKYIFQNIPKSVMGIDMTWVHEPIKNAMEASWNAALEEVAQLTECIGGGANDTGIYIDKKAILNLKK